MSALGAALFSIGIPRGSLMHYETAVTSNKFLVIAHGTTDDVTQAMGILETAGAAETNVHSGIRGDIIE